MTPYYSDDFVTIYHGDCRDWLSTAEMGGGVCLTDPPYGVGVDYGEFADTPANVAELIADAMPPLLRKCGRVALTPGQSNVWMYPPATWILAWVVPAGANQNPWGFTTWHPILVWGKDPYRAANMGARPDSITQTETSQKNGHPCPKPIDVWQRVAQRVSVDVSEWFIDPFMGSGTTLVAAKNIGRKAIGIEIEERYCEIAAQRCSQGVLAL